MNRRLFLLAIASVWVVFKSTAHIPIRPHEKEPVSFPLLFNEERNGKKVYLHTLQRKAYNELTNNFYVPVAGKRHWIGPQDIFLEYEMEEIAPGDPETGVTARKNRYRGIAWYRPEERTYQVSLKIVYDIFETEDGERIGKPDQWWRVLGPLENLRQFRYLLSLWEEMQQDTIYTIQQISYPLLFETDDTGNKSEIYHLERKKEFEIAPFMMLYDTPREIRPDDLFLEYEILDHFSPEKDSPTEAMGNLFRCQVCFTNNGGANSRVFIRILSDIFWNSNDQWQEDPDKNWREAGYLDEIPRFRQLLNAYRTYIEPLEE